MCDLSFSRQPRIISIDFNPIIGDSENATFAVVLNTNVKRINIFFILIKLNINEAIESINWLRIILFA
jgi:hypothetical protein